MISTIKRPSMKILRDFANLIRPPKRIRRERRMTNLFKVGLAIMPIIFAATSANSQEHSLNIQPQNPTETRCEKWQRQSKEQQLFPIVCAEEMSSKVIIKAASDVSKDKLMIVVWGGDDRIKLEAVKFAHTIHKKDIELAIAFAPSHHAFPNDVFIQAFANKKSRGGRPYNFAEHDKIGSFFEPALEYIHKYYFLNQVNQDTIALSGYFLFGGYILSEASVDAAVKNYTKN